MFKSWELLCRGTERNYPTTNDIFHSPNYARQQGTLDLRRQTNEACRICKLLEKEGRPREKLYMNHFGNLPTHCPHWTNMNSAEKKKTAKAAEYCLQCLSPNVRIKNKADSNKHNQRRCSVTMNKKHKYTCLNTSCLKHSWACIAHAEENRPLTEAHYKELSTWDQYMTTRNLQHHEDNKTEQKTPEKSKTKQRYDRRREPKKMPFKRTARPMPSNTTPGLQHLISIIKSRIHTSNHRITEMMTPIQSPAEGTARKDDINRVRNMASEIESSLLDIKNHHRETLDVQEIRNFRNLLNNIKKKTSSAHKRLADWKKKEQHLRGDRHETTPPEDTESR